MWPIPNVEIYSPLQGTTNTYQGTVSSHGPAFSLLETARSESSTDSLRCEHLGALWHLFSNSLSSTFIYFFLFLLASSHERDPTRDISTQRRRSELRAQGPGPPSDKCAAWKLAHNGLLRFRMSSLPSHVAKDGPMQLRVYGSHSRKCHLNLFSSLLFF